MNHCCDKKRKKCCKSNCNCRDGRFSSITIRNSAVLRHGVMTNYRYGYDPSLGYSTGDFVIDNLEEPNFMYLSLSGGSTDQNRNPLPGLGRSDRNWAIIHLGVRGFPEFVTDTFSTPGTHTWTPPRGFDFSSPVIVQMWGAGGGGGGAEPVPSTTVGGGGSGAFYSKNNITISHGDTLNIVIGAGGIGGVRMSGGNGGYTSIGPITINNQIKTIYAGGGGGGISIIGFGSQGGAGGGVGYDESASANGSDTVTLLSGFGFPTPPIQSPSTGQSAIEGVLIDGVKCFSGAGGGIDGVNGGSFGENSGGSSEFRPISGGAAGYGGPGSDPNHPLGPNTGAGGMGNAISPGTAGSNGFLSIGYTILS